VVIFGTVRLVSDPQEARRVMYGLIHKYFPLMTPGMEFREITDKELRSTSIYAVRIEEWSGKENWKDRADQSNEWAPLDESWFK
jgi:nitroimidazol reductase NimA-like FMN-containing flavoprotein (pyridoxamine 5'-phosphate oxidase superfamily)